MIEVKGLSYKINNKKILDDVKLDAYPGEMLCILGPNGAGKSTLIKMLCKELKTPKDCVYIHGKDINSYSSKEMALTRAVLTQANDVSINFSVEELVKMGRYPHFEINPTEADFKIIDTVLEEMGILHLRKRSYFSLSGGEKQRTQLARVLAQIYDTDNAILFLDEPINGLDLQFQQTILEKAKKMTGKGWTVVCILHEINFASRYADKILVLKNGKCIDYGIPKTIITEETLLKTYNIKTKIIKDEELGYPIIVPIS